MYRVSSAATADSSQNTTLKIYTPHHIVIYTHTMTLYKHFCFIMLKENIGNTINVPKKIESTIESPNFDSEVKEEKLLESNWESSSSMAELSLEITIIFVTQTREHHGGGVPYTKTVMKGRTTPHYPISIKTLWIS